MTYLKERTEQKFRPLILRALSALRFLPYSKTNTPAFKANHGRWANTAITLLRNLAKRRCLKNLNWNKVINQKLSSLDEANEDPFRMEDWDKRSDQKMAPQNRRCLRRLCEKELAERDIELHHPKEPPELRYRTPIPAKEAYAVYQQTGVTEPKDPARYKKLHEKIEKIMPHTVKMKKC